MSLTQVIVGLPEQRERIVAEIVRIKAERPLSWQEEIKNLLRHLQEIDRELDGEGFRGTEAFGRPMRRLK